MTSLETQRLMTHSTEVVAHFAVPNCDQLGQLGKRTFGKTRDLAASGCKRIGTR